MTMPDERDIDRQMLRQVYADYAASQGVMARQDRAITDLINALDAILRSTNLEFAKGAAGQAIDNVKAISVRNSDGYLVVR
jgi:hypothetical protein